MIHITITDGTGRAYVFETKGAKPDLIGHNYKIPSQYMARLLRNSIDEADVYYCESHPKPSIPEGTIVPIEHYWMNFYGEYFRVLYNGRRYDVKVKNIELVCNDSQIGKDNKHN